MAQNLTKTRSDDLGTSVNISPELGNWPIQLQLLNPNVPYLKHAKWLFRLIQELKEDSGENLEALTIEAEAPLVLGTTADNLIAAIAGEHYEYSEMYPEFADVAEEEGLEDIAVRLRAIGRAEEHHAI